MKKILFVFVIVSTLLIVKPSVNANDYTELFRMPSAVVVDSSTLSGVDFYINYGRVENYEITSLYIQHANLISSSSGSNILIPFDILTHQKYGIPTIELLVDNQVVWTVINHTMYDGILEFNSYLGTENIGETYVIKLSWRLYSPVTSEYHEGYNDGYEEGREDYGHYYDDEWLNAQNWGDIRYNEGYTIGYDLGDLEGYSRGQVEDFDGLSIITSGLFGFLSVLGSIQLLPGLRVSHVIGITMFFGLIYFIVGKVKK